MSHREKKKRKLSKGILEMKFMKKSKEKFDQEKKEEEGREIFAYDVKEIKQEGNEFIIEPSLVPIDSLICGRMSFKGMNPEIERLMEVDKMNVLAKVKEEERLKSNQPEISDKQMAQYLSRKSKRCTDEEIDSSDNANESSESEEEPSKKAKFMKPLDSD